MINRVSELPFWGPEEQIRRFINQHDEMSELYDVALKRLSPTINVGDFPTESQKNAKLKELIVSSVDYTIEDNKFTIDGVEYTIDEEASEISWGDSQTTPIYKSFILEHKGIAVDGEQVVIKQEYIIANNQVKWNDGSGKESSTTISDDNKFTIDEVEYTI